MLDHVAYGSGITPAVAHERLPARHVPAFGGAARPDGDVALTVRALVPGNFGILEVVLGGGLAGVDGDDEGRVLDDVVRDVDPPVRQQA